MATDSFGGTLIEDPKLDQFGGMILDDAKPEKSPSSLRRVADVGISVLKGAIGVPEAVVGLADLATGGYAGKAAEDVGFRPKEAKAFLDEYLSPQQQAANKALADTQGFLATIGTAVKNPSTILHSAVESLPLMGAGGIAARGLMKAAGVAPWAAGALGEGLAGAGSAAEQIRQESPDRLLDAKQTLSAVGSGLGTAAFGAAGGKLAQKLKIADIDTMIAQGGLNAPVGASAKGFARRLAEGAISEGVFEELPQSLQEQMWQNYATGRPIMERVPESGALGMLTGAVMGGPAAAVGGMVQPAPPKPNLTPREKLLHDTAEAVKRREQAEAKLPEAPAAAPTKETQNDEPFQHAAADEKAGEANAQENADEADEALQVSRDLGAIAPNLGPIAPETGSAAEPPISAPAETAPKIVAGIPVSAQSNEQLQTVAQSPETPATTRHAAVAAIAARAQNPEAQSSQPVAESQALAPEASDAGVAPRQAATLPENVPNPREIATNTEVNAPESDKIVAHGARNATSAAEKATAVTKNATQEPSIPALTLDQVPASLASSGFSPEQIAKVVSHLEQVDAYANKLSGGKTPSIFTKADIQEAIDTVIKGKKPSLGSSVVQNPASSTKRGQAPALNAPAVAKPRQVETTVEESQQSSQLLGKRSTSPVSQAESSQSLVVGPEVERFQGQYKGGMREQNARAMLPNFVKKNPSLSWTVEKSTANPDHFDIVGKKPAKAPTAAQPAATAQPTPAPDKAAPAPASQPANSESAPQLLGKPITEVPDKILKAAEKGKMAEAVKKEQSRRKAAGTPLGDKRLSNPDFRSELQTMSNEAGWAEVGGRILRDGQGASEDEIKAGMANQVGNIIGRTKWLPKAWWWTDRPKPTLNETQVRKAVAKALAGEPLNAGETRTIQYMLDSAGQTIEDFKNEPTASDEFTDAELADSGLDALPQNEQQDALELGDGVAVPDNWATMTEAEKNAYEDTLFGPRSKPSAAGSQEAIPGESRPAERPTLALQGETPEDLKAKAAAEKAPIAAESAASPIAQAVTSLQVAVETLARAVNPEAAAKQVTAESDNISGMAQDKTAAVNQPTSTAAGEFKEIDKAEGKHPDIQFAALEKWAKAQGWDVRLSGASSSTSSIYMDIVKPTEYDPEYGVTADKTAHIRMSDHARSRVTESSALADLNVNIAPGESSLRDAANALKEWMRDAVQVASNKSPAGVSSPVAPAPESAPNRSEATIIGTKTPTDLFQKTGILSGKEGGIADKNIQDFGEKIGGARKDTARPLGERGQKGAEESAEPGWRKRFEVSQIAASMKADEIGQWVIYDKRTKDWRGQPKQVGGTFATEEAADAAVPLIAVAQKHRVVPVRAESAPMTEAQVDAMLARDSAAVESDRNAPGRVEYMVIEGARKKLAKGEITQAQFDNVASKYAEAAKQYTPPIKPIIQPERTQAYEIWRDVTDRKRVKVVDQQFASREDAMRYMAEHAAEIMETKTGFGEEILAKPDTVKRTGVERRTGPATKEMFADTFGFRGVEFGLWNNQDERQEVMNHAYDGLLDLADVLNVSAKALSLNGDLALAFGARGQGLSGAKAHYETDYGVINLTKMTGAGSLAHEWFHALDHYLARQDTKAKSEKVKNSRGDMVYPSATELANMASHGFSYKSQVRAELQTAYDELIKTMFTKAEQYVEDTQRAEKFVGAARNSLADDLKEIRLNLTRGPSELTYMKRNNNPASAEQLATFDQLAAKLISGEDLETKWISTAKEGVSARAHGGMAGRLTNDTLEGISAILKAVRGRSGFSEQGGSLNAIRSEMQRYAERIKMLESAAKSETKTKRVPTSYAMENKKIDQGRASDYWTTPHEMAARAFSAYVEDKVGEQGNKSDFLAYGSDNRFYRLLNIRPFPEGAERVAINQAFDKFTAELKTRETDKGTALFSQGASAGATDSITPEMRQRGLALRARIAELIGNRPDVKVKTFMATPESPIGSYSQTPFGSVITMALNAQDELSIADHEGYHAAEDLILSDTERAVVAAAFRSNGRPIFQRLLKQAQAYDKANGTSIANEIATIPAEARAYGFEFFRRGDLTANGIIGRIFGKLRNFFERVQNAVNGLGFRSAEDVFDALDEGRLAGRERNAEGVLEGVFASRGKDDQTKTPAFRAWFKDSKVVDAEGKPLVVYHQTAADFDTFMPGGENPKLSGNAIWFRPSPAESKSAHNTLVGFRVGKYKEGTREIPAYVSIKRPLVIDDDTREWAKEVYGKDFPFLIKPEVRAELSKDYDGILYYSRPDVAPSGKVWSTSKLEEVIAFHPTQIKSAIGNTGAFDPNNPDIRFSRAAVQGGAIAGARQVFSDMTRSDRVLNRLVSKFNTQFHLAEVHPEFKPVYDEAQDFTHDVSRFTLDAADKAPDLLPRVEAFSDFKKQTPLNTDLANAADALYAGTLWGGGSPLEGRVWSDSELKSGRAEDGEVALPAGFKPMNDKQISLYRQFLATTAHALTEQGKSLIWRLAKQKDINLSQTMTLARMASLSETLADQQIEGKRATLEEAADADKAAIQKTIDELNAFKASVADIEGKTNALIEHGYAPAMRFGEYAVNVQTLGSDGKWTEEHFERFTTQTAANIAKRQLQEQYPNSQVTSGPINTEAYKLFQGLNLDSMELFVKHMTDLEGKPIAVDPVMQELFRVAVSERSTLKRQIHRKGTAGFSTDISRVLGQFTLSTATATARAYHAAAMMEHVQNIKHGDLQAHATRYVRYMQDPQEESPILRGFLANYFILGSIASGVVNMTQPILMTAPALTQHTSWTNAMKQLGIAAADLVKGRKTLTADEKAAYERASKAGVVSPQEIFQIRAEGQASMIGDSPLWQKMEEMAAARGIKLPGKLLMRKAAFLWGSIYSLAEQFNRGITFLSAYRIAKEMGGVNPYDFAAKMVDSTQGVYNKANRMEVSRGNIGSVVMTFKQFNVSYLELAKRLYDLRDANGKRNLKPFAVLMLTLMALSGAAGLPFEEDISDLIDTIGQWMGYSTNAKKALRKRATEILGKDMADIFLYGASAIPGVPIDVSQRMGMHNLIPGSAALKTSEPDKTRDIVELLGPAASVFKNTGRAIEGMATGKPGEAIALMPLAIQNVAKGAEIAETGQYRDMKGRKVMDAGLMDAMVKLVGFQPANVAQESRIVSQNMQDIGLQKVIESSIADKWARGIADKDQTQVTEARNQMRQWNADNPELRVVIQPGQIARRVKELRLSREERFLKSAPREIRGGVRQDLRQQATRKPTAQ